MSLVTRSVYARNARKLLRMGQETSGHNGSFSLALMQVGWPPTFTSNSLPDGAILIASTVEPPIAIRFKALGPYDGEANDVLHSRF